jgi:hypothetical protein
MLGALAGAAIGNFGMQFLSLPRRQHHDAVLHLGNVAILSALAGWIAHSVLGWRHARAAR